MHYSKNFKRTLIVSILIFLFIFALDQLTKSVVLKEIGLYNVRSFIPGLFHFTVVKNTGGAFSILNEYSICFKIIGLINMFIFSYLAFCPTVALNSLIRIGSACILGGTLGNLIDRFFRNGVVDFIDFEPFKFAVFNLADIFIDIGVILILIGWYCRGKSVCLPKIKNGDL